MPLAVILRLDAETAGTVDAMAHRLPERLDDDPGRTYPPHIKLAMFSDAVDAGDVDAGLATAATGRWSALPVSLAAIGVFPGDPAVVWLAPVPSTELLALHATLHRALADLPTHPGYEVGGWVPHVMLASTDLVGDTVEVLTSMWTGPISGWLDALDLVQFNPVRVLSRRPLRG